LAAAFSCLVLNNTVAWAACGAAGCSLVTGTQEGAPPPGQIVMDFSYQYLPMDQAHEGRHKVSEARVARIDLEAGVIEPESHSEVLTINSLAQVDVSYGVTERLGLTFSLPVYNNRIHEHFDLHREEAAQDDGDGHEEAPALEEEAAPFSNQEGTYGIGDLRLAGKYRLWMDTRNVVVGGLGVVLPTGEYKRRDHDGFINEPTLQPGRGAWGGMVSAYYTRMLLPHKLDAFASTAYQMLAENGFDYRMGNMLLVNGGVQYHLSDRLQARLQVNLQQAPHDELKGQPVPGTGGAWVYVTPGIQLNAASDTAFFAHVQLPVYQRVNEANLTPSYGLAVGLSRAFGG
jgi:hypothetical protein